MPTLQEEIRRVKELIFGPPETQTIKECGNMDIDVTEKDHDSSYMAKQQLYDNDEIVTTDLGEQIMAGLQTGYPDDSDGDNAYDFESKGALGSQTELDSEGFTEPETNYSKIKKGYNFDSDGPQDSYMDSSDEYNMELSYELGEQDDTAGTGESDDMAGAGTAALGVWESGVARGIANQIATGKWTDSYTTTRGKSNPVW